MTRQHGDAETRGIAGVILAGGENRRFPALKAFIKIAKSSNSPTIIERNLTLLKERFEEVFISTNMPERYFYLGMPLIGDVLPSRGPMSGIYSALINTRHECIFVTACDMPFVKGNVISFVCRKHAGISANRAVDATIPIFNDEPQPLFGVYCKTALPYLEEGILKGKTSMKYFLQDIKTNFISWSDIMTVDSEGRSFTNINTMEDYEKIVNSE